MSNERDRRGEVRDDPASVRRQLQQRDTRALKRLLLTVFLSMLAIALIGYALALWWG